MNFERNKIVSSICLSELSVKKIDFQEIWLPYCAKQPNKSSSI